MATAAKCAVPKTPGAPTNLSNSGHRLTPDELAELIASIEYDEAPAAVADCTDYDPK
jgi:hypothetical protein